MLTQGNLAVSECQYSTPTCLRKPNLLPRLTCYQLRDIQNCSNESLCSCSQKCAATGVCSETVSFLWTKTQSATERLSKLEGSKWTENFLLARRKIFQSWDELSQKQDGSVMIGLVVSVQFSPQTESRRFKNKGLRYYTKLFNNNVFLASHWASQKW